MSDTQLFLADLGLTVTVSGVAVAYLRRHLRPLLIELCGTAERAGFWLALSNVTFVLVPVILALDYMPAVGPGKSLLFEMATQLKSALIGLMATLLGLALVLIGFIRNPRAVAPGGRVCG